MDLFDLVAKITLDSSEYEKGLKDAETKTQQKTSGFGKALGKFGKTVGAAIGSGIVAMGAATVKIGGAALEAYSNYEQLTGGIETLFKDSSGTVLQYAENAYKTAGLSANDYMSTVTSFSASLLQSVGNDTEKAAQYANTAITDMSDNANKMGSDMSSIQSAYQGFAKQNYTMLDNLKLGYGGTKTEMERLILDAENLNGTFSAARDESGNLAMSYSDIVEAIHIVQTEMGVTGTTASEASTTIQGSTASAKAAWENLLVGIADENSNFEELSGNFIESVVTAGQNIIPRIGQIIQGIGQLLTVGASTIVPEVLNMIISNLPQLVSGGVQLILALVTGLISAIPQLVEMLPEIVMAIYNGIVEAGPELLAAGAELLTWIGEGIMSLLSLALEWGQGVGNEIKAGLVAAWEAIVAWVSTGMENIGSAISSAWETVTAPFIAMWEEMSAFVSSAWETITSAVSSALDTISSTIDSVWNTISSTVSSILEGISSTVSSVWDSIVSAVSGAVESVQSAISDAFETAKSAVSGAVEAISQTVTDVFNGIKGFLAPVVDWLAGIFDFSWELPQIKMPHFTVTGKFSLNPPSIPTFSISWYKKAYEEPYMFTQPTVMGGLGFGDGVGGEMVYGHENLMKDIREAVASQIGGISIYLDGKLLVGGTADRMDTSLGDIQKLKLRWEGV